MQTRLEYQINLLVSLPFKSCKRGLVVVASAIVSFPFCSAGSRYSKSGNASGSESGNAGAETAAAKPGILPFAFFNVELVDQAGFALIITIDRYIAKF
jgi:hypothetical protein